MNLAWLSLGALVVVMIASCFTALNVGVLALALAWIVGVYVGSMGLNEVLSGFPVQIFLTLTGVTLLFSQAHAERHTRQGHARRRAHLPGQHGTHPRDVLRAGSRHRVARAGQRGHRGDARAHGDGCCRTRRDSTVPDGHHGRQRRPGRGAFSSRSDRRHRDRSDGQDRAGRLRTEHVSRQPRRARHHRFRRIFPAWWSSPVRAPIRRGRGGSGLCRFDDSRIGSLLASSRPCSFLFCSSAPTLAWPLSRVPWCWPPCAWPTTNTRFGRCRGSRS